MQKKNFKKFNECPNKLKFKIPQPNKISSTSLNKKVKDINSLNNINLNSRKKKYGFKNMNNNNKSTLKDSLDENISESKINILIPDSLNNTRRSIIENISDKKRNENEKTEEETKKIDYRYYTNYPIKDFIDKNIINNNNINKEGKKYWLATYDTMMKKEKIIKILNYYYKQNKYKENKIKEKLMQIKDFEIYFPKESNGPLIEYNQKGYIFTKLYLLSLENINIILSYINRININIKSNELDELITKGNYKIISENNNFKYNIVYFMGNYLNINIYGFSNLIDEKNDNQINNKLSNNIYQSLDGEQNLKYPNSRKVAKLVKILMNNFPKYNSDFFIGYLLSESKIKDCVGKINEIKSYIYSKNTAEMHHKMINSNCLAEIAAYTSSLSGTSFITPFSSSKNNFFNEKINYYINTSGRNNEVIKYPTFINNIKLVNKNKININRHVIDEKNIIKVLSYKKENVKNKINQNTMNYIKIGLKKNNFKYENISLNNTNKSINKNKTTNLLYLPNKNITDTKSIYKKMTNKKENYTNRVKNINTTFNKISNNKTQQDNLNILSKFSLLNMNFNNDTNKKNNSKVIDNKKKKSTKKSYIFYDKRKAEKFFYNSKIEQKSFDKIKNNINFNKNKIQNNNLLSDSFELNDYLTKNSNNKNNIEKSDKIKKEKSKNKGIYVVTRRLKTDLEDDDSSSVFLKGDKFNNENKEFITPKKKKKGTM